MRALSVSAFCLGLLACRPQGPTEPTDPPPHQADDAGDAADETGPDAPAGCTVEGERFADLGWIPEQTRFAAWVEPAHPEYDAAAAQLSALAERAESIQPPLPIYAATDLSQLGFELSSLSTTLAFGGFAPAQLVKLHGPEGVPVYVWPLTCDLDVASAQLERAYGLAMRKAVDGRVGTPGPTDFPFDALLLRGDRAAFVPRDKAPLVLDWLGRPPTPTLDGQATASPGPRLSELRPAPFRILLQGRALAAGESETHTGVRTLRATASGVEIDGNLAAP